MADILTVADLESAKQDDTFHAEVITGKFGGNGANIDFATHARTGQVQKTLPKTIADIDWTPKGTFTAGGTLTKATDYLTDASGTQWAYTGTDYPKAVAGGTVPSSPTYQVVHASSASAIDYAAKTLTRTVQSKLSDQLSILDFGGLDDDNGSLTTTNSKNALAAYIAHLNSIGGGKLYLPKTLTGGYFINGDDTTLVTSPIEVVADEGVYIRLIYSGGYTNSPFASNKLKFNRQLRIYNHNFEFTNYGNEKAFIEPAATLPSITQGQGIKSIPRKLSGANFNAFDMAAPDVVVTPITQGSDAISFAGAGKVIAAIKPARKNEETFGILSSPASGKFFAGVKTLNGYAYVAQNTSTQAVTVKEITTGLSNIELGVPYTYMEQQRDLFNNSLLSVRVISNRMFSVLCNGLVIGTYDTRSNITGVMFGADNVADTITLSQPSCVVTKSTGGSKPLRVTCVGDSTGDNNVQYSQFRLMSSILQTSGVQLAELNNIAVSGENAAQQYTRLQTVGAGYDYCLIQIGINDIQGSTAFASFTQTIKDMITYSKSVGMTAIVGIPAQYYSLAEAMAHGQGGGQNTSNNANGFTYRALLIRAVAEVGGLVNLQSLKDYGAMTASWLDATIEGVQQDRIVVDNIHPTPYGSMMLGLGWAESVVGALHGVDNSEFSAKESAPASWMRNGFGVTSRPVIKGYTVSGRCTFDGATTPSGAVFMQVPQHLRPLTTLLGQAIALDVSDLPLGVITIYIGTDGSFWSFNLPVGTKSIDIRNIDLAEDLIF